MISKFQWSSVIIRVFLLHNVEMTLQKLKSDMLNLNYIWGLYQFPKSDIPFYVPGYASH